MTTAHPPAPSAHRLRRARGAASVYFLVNGALFANLLPRLPEIKDAFGLSDTAFGFVVIAFPLGALAAGMAPAPLLRRFGSARVAGWGSLILAGLVALAGVFGGLGGPWPALVAYLASIALAGVLDAIVDTAQNAQAIDIQKSLGRSILNSMHALWSLGAMTGSLMGSAAVALELPLPVHLTISGALFAVLVLAAQRHALTQAEVESLRHVRLRPDAQVPSTRTGPVSPPRSSSSRAVGLVVLISLIAIAGAMVEDLGMNWSALYFSRVLESPAAFAGMGLVALMAAQFVGRLLGDRMIDRLGRVVMTRVGATLAAVGLGVVALAPAPWAAVLGFALAGFGCATLVPSAFHAADSVPGLRPGTGLALSGWLLRAAFLSVSPLVGVISDAAGLRLAVLVVPAVALLAVLIAGVLRERQPETPAHV